MNPESNSPGAPFNRREFLKTGAAVAGGLVVSRVPGAQAMASRTDKAIRVGLVGCGGRGTGAAFQALATSQDVKLVAMADAFRDRLDESYDNLVHPQDETEENKRVASRVDVPEEHKFTGFDGYLKVIPLVDVVLLVTPPAFRPMHFEAAIDAGKHVFMEKPVATDAPGIRKVLEVAEKAKKKQLNVVVGLQRHYQRVYTEWVDRIHDGAIGDVVLGRVYWNSSGVWVRPRQPQWNEMEYQMRNWYYFTWLCGDHIVEQHIHNIDVGNWVKHGPPVRAQGQGGRQVRTGPDTGQIFDHHFVEFEYADGSRMMSQCRHMPDCMNRVSEAFHGTAGSAPEPGTLLGPDGTTIWQHRGKDDPNPYQVEHDELFAAIAAGRYAFADAERGAEATMTSILGRMATYSGRVIEWDEALNSQVSLMPERFAWDAAPPVLPDAHGAYPVPVPGVSVVV
jgi:predicted dehydrogenase